MITKFEVGKTYRYTGTVYYSTWAYKEMGGVLDGKPRLCTKAGDMGHPYYALFEGISEQLSTYQDGTWDWTSGIRYWEEVTVPQFQRGDRVVVWDTEGDGEHERDFVSYIKGARYPYITTVSINDELFSLTPYNHCKPLLPVDEKLARLILDVCNAQRALTDYSGVP